MNEDTNIEDSNIEDSKIKSKWQKESIEQDKSLSEEKSEEEEGGSEEEQEISDKEDVEDRDMGDSDVEDIDVGESEIVRERKEKLVSIFKKKNLLILGFLIIALILGIYIRSMPMHDHGGGIPGLWDITTDTWTLGPDLDPWLFTRYAKAIVEGGLPKLDMMRSVPLGYETSKGTRILPYMIAGTYYLFNIFGDYNINFAAVIFPVIMFALTILAFFFFVREIFIKPEKKRKANIIALISTFFMIIIPAFLSRTIAGIPEKESAGFFFLFFTFYLFLKAWKSKTKKQAVILGISTGIATALMSLIWGGVIYVFFTIAIATFIAFIFNKINTKRFIAYSLWIFSSLIIISVFSASFSFIGAFGPLNTLFALSVFFILLIDFILWETRLKSKAEKISEMKILRKIPKNIISLIIAIILIAILGSILSGPKFIFEKIDVINERIFKPTFGRFNITVAENRRPFFTEWVQSFGPFIKNIPILFWLFFAGSVVLFKKMLKNLKKKDAWILTGLYIFFFCGLILSRYSSESVFNGENFISRIFYYASALLLIIFLIYYYIKYYKSEDLGFKKINFEYLFLFSFLVLCLFGARSAIRLVMILATITPIFVSFLIVDLFKKFKENQDETGKIILGAIVILILILSIFAFWTFYKEIKSQAYNMIPSVYNKQWQKAMQWVRQETPKSSVFGHWWDYGYWLQSIGERATVLDGGNTISFWNYYMGRLVLTGDNQDDALEFLYNHNTTHFLIDSSDIGKYGAYSSIGSNEDHDRYSWIGTFILDDSQTQETNNETIFTYPGGIAIDEDIMVPGNNREVLLPGQASGIGAMFLPMKNDGSEELGQPYIIAVYQDQQYALYLRYLSAKGEFIDFGSGIEACAYVFPRLTQQGGGIDINPIGAALYLSPRLMRGMMVQTYILDDPFNNFPNFKLVHTENSLVLDDLRRQGMGLPDIIYFQGIRGPIKIWEIEYTGKEEYREDYIDTDASKYLRWPL